MPIRTDRGRNAAVRMLWAWPLKSRLHLAITIGVLVAVPTVVLAAIPSRHQGAPASSPAAAYSSATAVLIPTTASPTSTDPRPWSVGIESSTPAVTTSPSAAPGTTVADHDEPLMAAIGFITAWLRPGPGTTADQWMQRVRPFVMPETVSALTTVAPENIPATRVTADPVVTATSPSVIEVNVGTDAGLVHVVVVRQPTGRWLVRTWNLASR